MEYNDLDPALRQVVEQAMAKYLPQIVDKSANAVMSKLKEQVPQLKQEIASDVESKLNAKGEEFRQELIKKAEEAGKAGKVQQSSSSAKLREQAPQKPQTNDSTPQIEQKLANAQQSSPLPSANGSSLSLIRQLATDKDLIAGLGNLVGVFKKSDPLENIKEAGAFLHTVNQLQTQFGVRGYTHDEVQDISGRVMEKSMLKGASIKSNIDNKTLRQAAKDTHRAIDRYSQGRS